MSCDLIVGYGEIGQAVLHYFHGCVKDLEYSNWNGEDIECMHICFPYSEDFIEQVKENILLFKPKYVVIHSTVPIGTCSQISPFVVHSPVSGIHPNLVESLRTFTKFLGCADENTLAEVADHFRRAGLTIYTFDKPETTELMKILCTTNYGLNIEFTKEVKRLCDKYNVPFEAFTLWNNNYNASYEKLGHPEYHRYNLVPLMKKIGAHCVLPNCELLDSAFTKLVKELNGEN